MADTRGTEWRYIGTRNGHDWRDTYYWHDGKSGDTSGEALARVATMKKQLVPFCQVVLLMIGGNDLLQKVPATTTVQNIQDIADSLAKEGAKVYIQTVLPVRINDHDSNIYWNTRIVLLNQKIKAEIDLKGGEYNHTILDTWKAFTDAGQGMGSSALDSLYTDGVHLSSWGYWILANFVRSVVP
jgi:lysophospholipase L1-like esterase